MLNSAVARAINHLLHGETWAQDRLRGFAGKTARLSTFPLNIRLGVGTNGEVFTASAEAADDVHITIPAVLLPRILSRDENAFNQVSIVGDAEFAATIAYLFKNLRWDIEQDLSHLCGDIIAHRIVETGKKAVAWPAEVHRSITTSFADYWTEEQPLLAKRHVIEGFSRDIDTLRDDLARLEKRLSKLATDR